MLPIVLDCLLLNTFAISPATVTHTSMEPNYFEGDKVIVDGAPGLVVKVGTRETVFGIHKPDGSYNWRFVNNEKIMDICQK